MSRMIWPRYPAAWQSGSCHVSGRDLCGIAANCDSKPCYQRSYTCIQESNTSHRAALNRSLLQECVIPIHGRVLHPRAWARCLSSSPLGVKMPSQSWFTSHLVQGPRACCHRLQSSKPRSLSVGPARSPTAWRECLCSHTERHSSPALAQFNKMPLRHPAACAKVKNRDLLA